MSEELDLEQNKFTSSGYFSVNTDLGLNQVGGYILSICEYNTDADRDKNIFNFDISKYDFVNCFMQAYILRDNYLELDIVRNREIKEAIDKTQKQEPPTYQERIESQLIYTALMTDTLIDEDWNIEGGEV